MNALPRRLLLAALPVLAIPALATAASPPERSSACEMELATRLGNHHLPITTTQKQAQELFDQGLRLSYAFNHAEAERSFRRAIAADPSCAMCYWGAAYVLGPNINAPMNDTDVPAAYDAAQTAYSLRKNATPLERALIEALTHRYAATPVIDRSPLDQAYADAMAQVYAAFPDDTDAGALYAEALLDTRPWSYWGPNGEATAFTDELLQTLEHVLSIDADHPGANHFYIHAVEKYRPAHGLPSALRLATLVPGAGHLVHMPSHIYLRVGLYGKATEANQMAVAADRQYLQACAPHSFYTEMYVRHNLDFLAGAALLEGRSALTISTAQELSGQVRDEAVHMPAMLELQQFMATPWLYEVAFGRWNDVLAIPEPDSSLLFARGLWHYARSIALIRTGDLDAAEDELADLRDRIDDPSLTGTLMAVNDAKTILAVGLAEASGELEAARGDYDAAVTLLEEAVSRQDQLTYMEPPPWYHSTRLNLGAVLLEAGRPQEAETVFRANLEQFPNNGWGLFGLHQALLAQQAGQQEPTEEILSVQEAFEKAWRNADVALTAARF